MMQHYEVQSVALQFAAAAEFCPASAALKPQQYTGPVYFMQPAGGAGRVQLFLFYVSTSSSYETTPGPELLK
jgi:hypothetical protein